LVAIEEGRPEREPDNGSGEGDSRGRSATAGSSMLAVERKWVVV
jgi:hypothetical protein